MMIDDYLTKPHQFPHSQLLICTACKTRDVRQSREYPLESLPSCMISEWMSAIFASARFSHVSSETLACASNHVAHARSSRGNDIITALGGGSLGGIIGHCGLGSTGVERCRCG